MYLPQKVMSNHYLTANRRILYLHVQILDILDQTTDPEIFREKDKRTNIGCGVGLSRVKNRLTFRARRRHNKRIARALYLKSRDALVRLYTHTEKLSE